MGSLNWASGLWIVCTWDPFNVILLIRSDKPVYATASIRPTGPLPAFTYLTSGIPIRTFHRRLHEGLGRSHGGFQYFAKAPYQSSGAQGRSLCPTALGPSAPGPPGYDRYGQFDNSFVYQQARRDPFPHLVTSGKRLRSL